MDGFKENTGKTRRGNFGPTGDTGPPIPEAMAEQYPIVLQAELGSRISEEAKEELKKIGYDIVILDDFSTPMPEGRSTAATSSQIPT